MTVPLDVAPVFQAMWVLPVKMIVPTGGSVGPPSACGHASGWVLVIEAVNEPELGPPPAVFEQPLNKSAVAPVFVSGLVPVWLFLS